MAIENLKQETASAPPVGEAMRFRLAGVLLRQMVNDARVQIVCEGGGPSLALGKPGAQSFTMTIDRPATLWALMRDPDPGLGEAYMGGRWSLVEGDIGAFITMLARGRQKLFEGPAGGFFTALIGRHPPDYDHGIENSYRQVQHHYDIGNDLYALFLDEGMNYSCAFFETPEQSLRDAQLNKIRIAIRRLDVQPGMKVLDIGCGWGETTRILAGEAGARAAGVTLAENQLRLAKLRAENMDNPPDYFLQDYREHAAQHQDFYDRIVSIGMFEHVGDKNHDVYFRAVQEQLKPGGRALIHSIVRSGRPSTASLSSPWLDKYIFPGGCIPEVGDIVKGGEKQGLELAHEPYIQPSFHYAETLRRWRANFAANAGRLNPAHYDARFTRMWIYYLAMCEAMFDGCGYRVAQTVFKKPA